MAWDKGFNFRQTSTFVTDGANETYVLSESYPTTRNAVTFGWESAPSFDRDRDSGIDRRLAGLNGLQAAAGNAEAVFRVDLPATGDYAVRFAFGDAGNGASKKYGELRDTSSVLKSYSEQTVSSNHYDADETAHSAANWPANNAAHTYTFATTICRYAMKRPGDNQSVIEHMSLSQVSTTSRGMPFGTRGTAFNGGRTLKGVIA